MSESLVLFDNAFSPYAFKVRATLYEKGIEHEKHEMRYAADRAALLVVNRRSEIPALQHGETVVTDSSLISDYLESQFPEPPLMPASAAGQARCRELERLADGPLDGVIIALAAVKMIKPSLQKSHPEVAGRANEKIAELYAHLERSLGDAEFFCGELSRADLALVTHVFGGQMLGCPPAGRLAAWFERMSERPAVKRATAEFIEAMTNGSKDEDPFFSSRHLHMRDHRLEWCFRLGLGGWLADELEAGRVVFSPVP
jgi:glutathione S-transferase